MEPKTAEDQKQILYREEGQVAFLALNRPEKCNALSLALLESLDKRLRDLKTCPNIRVLVLSGMGNHFCGGLDLLEAADGKNVEISPKRAERFYGVRLPRKVLETFRYDDSKKVMILPKAFWMPRLVAGILLRLALIPQVVVGIAQGGAYGGGGALLASCDIALGAANLRLGFPECRRGLAPALLHPFLTRRAALSSLYPYLLSGEAIPLAAALRMGLVDVPLDEGFPSTGTVPFGSVDALPAIKSIVCGVLAGSPASICQAKKQMVSNTLPPTGKVLEVLLQHWESWNQPSAREGINAFLEKRVPRWC